MTPSDDTVLAPERFSERIRTATWGDHGNAEHSDYMEALMAGELSLGEYSELVVQQWFVYRALEAGAAALAEDPVVAPFLDPSVLRLDALEADLDVLLGEGWRERVVATAETQAYVDRLTEVAAEWPAGFVAHHYTRYMGDLSGGQFIGKLVRSTYDLADDRGAAFYRFGDLREPGAWKERYRRRLDELDLSEDEGERMIEEVRAAYRHNTAVFAGLDEHVLGRR